jgi:hypothetical protein
VLVYVTVYGLAAVIALATGLVFTVILRAIAGSSERPPVRRPSPRPVKLDDYGLLRTVVLVESFETGRSIRGLLTAGGVRATTATGTDGLTRILVFPAEYEQARRMVSWVL